MFKNDPQISAQRQKLEQLKECHDKLEDLTARLRHHNLDLDLLDEQVRKKLHLLHPNERTIAYPPITDADTAQDRKTAHGTNHSAYICGDETIALPHN